MKLFLVILAMMLLGACTQTQYLYYGNTSQSYYRAVKNPDPSVVAKYKKSLEDVFAKSEQKNLPVPPGLYCDYAMLLAGEGDLASAKVFLSREKALWPESAVLVDFLLARYELRN